VAFDTKKKPLASMKRRVLNLLIAIADFTATSGGCTPQVLNHGLAKGDHLLGMRLQTLVQHRPITLALKASVREVARSAEYLGAAKPLGLSLKL